MLTTLLFFCGVSQRHVLAPSSQTIHSRVAARCFPILFRFVPTLLSPSHAPQRRRFSSRSPTERRKVPCDGHSTASPENSRRNGLAPRSPISPEHCDSR